MRSYEGYLEERYVQALYQVLLGRTGDPSEVAAWVNSGQANSAIASAFLGSGEFRQDSIEAFYIALLHRPSDGSGFNGWFNSNLSLPDILIGIESSGEYFSNG